VARFQLTHATLGPGARRLRAGQTIADTQGNALPGDFVWTGLSSANMPLGCTPLDGAGTTMRNASRWASVPVANACTGVDSIDA
jgi:hypothetical protein